MHGVRHKSNSLYSPVLLTQNVAKEKQTSILRYMPALVKEGLFMIEVYTRHRCLQFMLIVLCAAFMLDVDAWSWCLMSVFEVDVWMVAWSALFGIYVCCVCL
jgi:hypothetical protein